MLNSIKLNKIILIIAILFVSSVLSATTDKTYSLKFIEDSSLWIEGDSNVHAYKTATKDLDLDTEVFFSTNPEKEGISFKKLLSDKTYQPELKELVLNLVVDKFHSSTIGFDSKFNSTMKYKEHPKIIFTMTGSSITADGADGNKFNVKINGILRIAGKEKPIAINSTAIVEDQKFRLTGSKDLLMTDFGIEPPTFLFLTAKDKITVKWNLTITIIPAQIRKLASRNSE